MCHSAFKYCLPRSLFHYGAEVLFIGNETPGEAVSRKIYIRSRFIMFSIETPKRVGPYRVSDSINPMLPVPVSPNIEASVTAFYEIFIGIALRAAYTWRAWNIAVFFELAHIMAWKKKICKYIEHYDKD